MGVVILVAIVINTNYDVTVNNQKLDQIVPVESIKEVSDEIVDSIPVESIGETLYDVSNSIPVKIEPKSNNIDTNSAKESKQHYPTVTLKMDNRPSGGVTADFTINRVNVVESQYYKIININVLMTMHMKLQDQIYFSPTFWWVLKSPSGEIYTEQCHGRQFDTQLITGKQNPNITWDICFHVEKELNKFDLLKKTSKIGTIILD